MAPPPQDAARITRLLLRRLAVSHPASRSALLRTFAHNTATRTASRPQLPFLSVPSASASQQQLRYLTTKRKAWLKHELLLSVRYTLYLWGIITCLVVGGVTIHEELAERDQPTPHEWRFRTRLRLRGAHWNRHGRTDLVEPDWVAVISAAGDVVSRLEDPRKDGAGVVDAAPPGKMPAGTKDISTRSENWRRGYYEALMLYAEAAEHLDGWVVDRTRDIVFPPDVVLGPSNPRPKPIPAGAQSAPREEDCDVAYPSADGIYLKILATEGFTTRQRMDAALALANHLDFKNLPGPALIMLEDAVDMALSQLPAGKRAPLDPKTWVLRDEAGGIVSENLLKSLTAYATFKARHGDVTSALPILISILRARRALPRTSTAQPERPPPPPRYGDGILSRVVGTISSTLQPPPYPPPPPDGSAPPPMRDPGELCEEAALHLHIGEIMYTARTAGREDGLSWTRDAVDVAEEQLHVLGSESVLDADEKKARTACRECLAAGLDNWARMVGRMARDEDAREEGRPAQSSFGWLGLWGEGKRDQPGRWEAEASVVEDRKERAKELLEDLEPPSMGLFSWFKA